MCNTYRIIPKPGKREKLSGRISAEVEKLGSKLVRKSDPGVVVLADERVEIMRWGFHRSFNPAINNARSDKMETGMWRDAIQSHRCVIPMSLFYEWGAGAGGRKQAHEFRNADDDFLWVAGIWEERPELGNCYSMVTTEAPPLMAPIHHRMPAVMFADEVATYLSVEAKWSFKPFAGDLLVTPCDSPLAKPRDPDPQQELF